MAQQAAVMPHAGHEPYAPPPHHVLAQHHGGNMANGVAVQPQLAQQVPIFPPHSVAAPAAPPPGPPRRADYPAFPPSSASFYAPSHPNTSAPPLPPHHHISPHHTGAAPPIPHVPPIHSGPSSHQTTPSAPTTGGQEWLPNGPMQSGDRRPSLPFVYANSHSAVASPDPAMMGRRASEVFMQNGGRTSDTYLARAANEKLVIQDHSMSRQTSEMGSMPPEEDDGRVGVQDPCAERRYTELKVLGDGSFGTVWLCDWHSPVKSDVLLSAMQCGAGARPEWAGKRLVGLKRMKRVWEGGWRQARNLGELVSLRTIPPHPAVIPLYDAFISPRTRELYFVFECMEGNLYQLTKSRKGRPLAAGLIASCFQQIVSGLCHIHQHGYFHRDMKPENLLVTTTGLCDYLSTATVNEINARRAAGDKNALLAPSDTRIEKDVQVIIKLADFGLARAITSKPPYTEYVSTRWYRAPEVLLRSTDYGAPVDMWALGTILAEMINLKPLFPGASEIDQVYRICDMLGDPCPENGPDEQGRIVGGGRWNTGIKLAKKVGFSFPKRKPLSPRSLFPQDTPRSLVDCIANLLRYNPRYRMTSRQCMDHPYFHEVLPHLQRMPPLPRIPFANGQPPPGTVPPPQQPPVEVNLNIPSRPLPPSHSHQEPHPSFANGDIRQLPPPDGGRDTPGPSEILTTPNGHPPVSYFSRPPGPQVRRDSDPRNYGASALVHQLRELDLPTDDLASYGTRHWSEEQLVAARTGRHDGRPNNSSNTSFTHHSSNPSFTSLNQPMVQPATSANVSLEHVPQQRQQSTNPHVMAYLQRQAAYQQQNLESSATLIEGVDPNTMAPAHDSTGSLPMHSPPQPSHPSHSNPKLPAPSGKKKKWGLSSVFGGTNKSASSLASVDEHGASNTSLKRTQSGQYADERVSIPTDPKMSKKEAERQLAKAKREAAERAQKERARAVLNKRNQLLEKHAFSTLGDLVHHSDSPNAQRHSNGMDPAQQPGHSAYNVAGYPGSQASTSAQSLGSIRSSQSPYLNVMEGDGMSRHKARKTTEDDDHSSIGRVSARSRSMLSVGTIDSDPGPNRSVPSLWGDPMLQQAARRPPSHTYRPSNMSHSAASLESQLASQLQRQATVASASESSLSIGRHMGATITNPIKNVAAGHRMSEPSSPYGHPASYTVSKGTGPSRHHSRSQLPSIGDFSHDNQQEIINPMFRVPPQQQDDSADQTSLPPFSALANVANTHSSVPYHPHQQQQQQ